MSWTICIPVPKDSTTIDGKRRICFVIPERIWPHFWNQPDPPPFVTHPDFDKSSALHLQTLATIDRFAQTLPNELSHDIQRSVAANMQSLGKKFGVGIELGQHNKKG